MSRRVLCSVVSRQLLVLLPLLLIGCGGKRPPAAAGGAVKYGGEVVAQGSIRFDPVDANDAQPVGAKVQAGKYDIPIGAGLVEGEYQVAIYATRETGKMMTPAEGLNNTPSTPTPEVEQYIPESYNANTSLRAKLKAGSNTDQNFDLKLGEKPALSNPSIQGPGQ